MNFSLSYKIIARQLLSGYRQTCRSTSSVALFNFQHSWPGHIVPLLSLRKVPYKLAIGELNWILSGSSNINDLPSNCKHVWEPWANQDGYIQSSYGHYLRRFPKLEKSTLSYGEVDQLSLLIQSLVTNNKPSRRYQLTLNQPDNFWTSDLPPCLSGLGLNWTQIGNCRGVFWNIKFRSSDFVLGFTWDIFQYYLLAQAIIQVANKLNPRANYYLHTYTFSADNIHIYEPHIPNLRLALQQPSGPVINWDSSQLKVAYTNYSIDKVTYKVPKVYYKNCGPNLHFELFN